MKTILIILCLFCFNNISICQDNIKESKEKKFQIAVMAGGSYKNILGKRYIEPTPMNLNDGFLLHQFDGFTKMPTYGFQFGFLITYEIFKHWHFTSGLLYSMRRDIYESKYDTVIKYHALLYNASNSYYNLINNVFKYDYSYNNIELPLMLQFKISKLSFYGGIHLSLMSFYKAKYNYLRYSFNNNYVPPSLFFLGPDFTSQKTIEYIKIPLVIYPTFQASYDLKVKKLTLSPFLGIDLGTKKSLYLQGGIIFSL